MWVLIDNYDSFTWILQHYLLQTGNECVVYRNDEISLRELIVINPERIIISPGPCTPMESGISMQVIEYFHSRVPILGVCLGHQALGMYFGGKLMHGRYPMHGKTSPVTHNGHGLFNNVPTPTTVMRYHSLVITTLEDTDLDVIAQCEDGTIMAVAHKYCPSVGVQFHPESVGTEYGKLILSNWANLWK